MRLQLATETTLLRLLVRDCLCAMLSSFVSVYFLRLVLRLTRSDTNLKSKRLSKPKSRTLLPTYSLLITVWIKRKTLMGKSTITPWGTSTTAIGLVLYSLYRGRVVSTSSYLLNWRTGWLSACLKTTTKSSSTFSMTMKGRTSQTLSSLGKFWLTWTARSSSMIRISLR